MDYVAIAYEDTPTAVALWCEDLGTMPDDESRCFRVINGDWQGYLHSDGRITVRGEEEATVVKGLIAWAGNESEVTDYEEKIAEIEMALETLWGLCTS
jgi:hypothetical protein